MKDQSRNAAERSNRVRAMAFLARNLWCVCLAVALSALRPVWAAFPDQPITIVIPYTPGGPSDLMARPLSSGLQTTLGVPVILQYKPGAGGQIALQYVERAQHDGYTLVLALAAYAIGPLLSKNAGYDPIADFQPVSLVAKQPLVLYTGVNSQYLSVADLIVRARANPDKVTVASSGYGNTSHLAIEMLSQATGVRLTHIPYHGGAPSVTAAMTGDVDAVFAGADSLRFVKAGKLRALAVANDNRLGIAQDTPTFSEAGIRNMSVTGWYGVLAPKGTPAPRVEKLNQAVQRVLLDLSKNNVLSDMGFHVIHAGPADFRTFIEHELSRWRKLVIERSIGID